MKITLEQQLLTLFLLEININKNKCILPKSYKHQAISHIKIVNSKLNNSRMRATHKIHQPRWTGSSH